MVFLLRAVPSVLSLLLKWLLVHQAHAFGGFDSGNSALAIIHLAIVPHEIKLPEIAVQVLAADVVGWSRSGAMAKRIRFMRNRADL